MKKVLNKVFFAFAFALTLGTAACSTNKKPEPSISQTENESFVKSVKVNGLEGKGTVDAPYTLELNEAAASELSLTIDAEGKLNNALSFNLASGSDILDITGSNDSKLIVKGLKAGEGVIEIKANDSHGYTCYVKVSVRAEEKVSVKSIYLSLEEGDGTLEAPYILNISATQEDLFTYNVRPNNATNKTINWTTGVVEGGSYKESAEVPFTIDDSSSRVVIKAGEAAGEGYIKGEATDGSNVATYIKVNVIGFKNVEGITSDKMLKSDEEGIDYVIHTAVGLNWDMTEGELDRKQGLVDGTQGPGQGQALEAGNLTYWPSLYNVGLNVAPADASDKSLSYSYSADGIVKFNDDGSYEALAAGESIVTIASVTNPDVKINVKVVVDDVLYSGILMDKFVNTPVSEHSSWYFDDQPDDLRTRPLLLDWNYVQVQTNTLRGGKGDDGNQKIFFLGNANRVYGFCLESNVAMGDLSKTTALAWNKTHIAKDATTIDIELGNNDKKHGQYKITLVDADKNIYVVKDWTSLTTPNYSGRLTDLVIPEEAKDKDVAIVIEQRLTEQNNNAELHVKGVWVNQYVPVGGIEFSEAELTLGQGGAATLKAEVLPANATNKAVTYIVTPANKGVRVDELGNITVDIDATVGDYTIKAVSQDNKELACEYVLHVTNNKPVTSFELEGIENNEVINMTMGNAITGDAPITLRPIINEDASDKTYTVEILEGSSVEISNNQIVAKGTGETKLVAYPNGNPEMKLTFTVNVSDYAEGMEAIKGLNKTEASNMISSAGQWYSKNVDMCHGGNKVDNKGLDEKGEIVLEGHATKANYGEAINIVYNKLFVDGTMNSLVFKVQSHADDRLMESTNFRVRAINANGEVVELLGWTTVANRIKQNPEWFLVSLDVTAFHDQTVVFVIEQTGSLQNNGDFPKDSDSAAGAYLHLKEIALSKEAATPFYTHRMYTRTDENKMISEGWYSSSYFYNKNYSNNFGGAYNEDGSYNPLVLQFASPLSNAKGLALSTVTQFINHSSDLNPLFYTWGIYPALNNDFNNNELVFSMDNNDVCSLEGNIITPKKAGTASLIVKAKAYGSDTEYVEFEVVILVKEENMGGNDPVAPVTRTEWNNKGEILEDWTVDGRIDAGVGEGADLQVGSGEGWSALQKEIAITEELNAFTFGARVFHRDGETYPRFEVRIGDAKITALGQENSFVYVDTDDIQHFTYDLSQFIGQTITINLGITTGTHGVVTDIKLSKLAKTSWANKAEILADWTVDGRIDAGVGEGADLQVGSGEGWSALTKEVTINDSNKMLSFGARVFHRDGETYPRFEVRIGDATITAVGQENSFVYVDTDDIQHFTYDLSQFIGQTITINLGITTGTHGVVTDIKLAK